MQVYGWFHNYSKIKAPNNSKLCFITHKKNTLHECHMMWFLLICIYLRPKIYRSMNHVFIHIFSYKVKILRHRKRVNPIFCMEKIIIIIIIIKDHFLIFKFICAINILWKKKNWTREFWSWLLAKKKKKNCDSYFWQNGAALHSHSMLTESRNRSLKCQSLPLSHKELQTNTSAVSSVIGLHFPWTLEIKRPCNGEQYIVCNLLHSYFHEGQVYFLYSTSIERVYTVFFLNSLFLYRLPGCFHRLTVVDFCIATNQRHEENLCSHLSTVKY